MPKITKIEAFQINLPLHEGSYKWSGGNSVEVFDSTVIAVHTDTGVTGYGEVCPLGPAYLPAYAEGARAGIAKLAPHLIGLDPTALGILSTAAWTPPFADIPTSNRPRHGVLGHSGQGCRAAPGHAARRPIRRDLPVVPRHLPGKSARHGREGVTLSRRRLHEVPTQSGRRPQYGYRTHSPGRRCKAPTGRCPHRRRQYRMDAASSPACGRCRPRSSTSSIEQPCS